jgi:hypothetical protein
MLAKIKRLTIFVLISNSQMLNKILNFMQTFQMIDEIQNAENLMEDLKTKHRARKRELADSLKKDTDVKGELGTARMRSKAKLEASLRERAAATDEMLEAETVGRLEEGMASRLEEGILEDLAPEEEGGEGRKLTPSPRVKKPGRLVINFLFCMSLRAVSVTLPQGALRYCNVCLEMNTATGSDLPDFCPMISSVYVVLSYSHYICISSVSRNQ